MSPRTAAPPLGDPRLWRLLKGRCHPDAGGSHDLFLLVSALEEHVSECRALEAPPASGHPRPDPDGPARVPYDVRPDEFGAVTTRALRMAYEVGEPHASLLRLLTGLYPEDHGRAWYAQQVGASYKQLALIAHRAGLSKAERMRWYEIAESVPLSLRHAAHILGRLGEEACGRS